MDINDFYKTLFEDTLGLDILGLESQFKKLVELVNRRTLKTFSEYIPCYFHTIMNPWDPRGIVSRDTSHYGIECIIRDPTLLKFNLPILDIVECNYPSTNIDTFRGNIFQLTNDYSIDGILLGAEQTYMTTILDNAIPFKPYWEYRGNDLVYFSNLPDKCDIELVIKTVYPNVVSIPEAYRESFLQLATFDIKIKLWNELKYIEDIATPVGNLNLKISDWESASRDRLDWLNQFKIDSMPDRVGSAYFTIL